MWQAWDTFESSFLGVEVQVFLAGSVLLRWVFCLFWHFNTFIDPSLKHIWSFRGVQLSPMGHNPLEQDVHSSQNKLQPPIFCWNSHAYRRKLKQSIFIVVWHECLLNTVNCLNAASAKFDCSKHEICKFLSSLFCFAIRLCKNPIFIH